MRTTRLYPFSFFGIFAFLLLLTADGFAQSSENSGKRKGRSPFADSQELTSSDYLAAIDRANDLMNTVAENGEFKGSTRFVFNEIKSTNASINLITKNINESGNTNLRNQRMYEKVLLGLQERLLNYQETLNADTERITGLKKQLRTVMKDTIFRKLVRDSIIRLQYVPQLTKLKTKFFATDSVLKNNLKELNIHKAENTRKKMVIAEALVVVNDRLEKSGVLMFKKERPNIWEIGNDGQNADGFLTSKFSVEGKAFAYYFQYSLGIVVSILILMGLLWWGIRYNLNSVRTFNKIEALEELRFRALNNGSILPVAVIGLNIAIALNLYAPGLFIEFLHFLLLAALTVMFYKNRTNHFYKGWLLLVGIFVAISFIELFLQVTIFQRCLFLLINVLCIRIGITQLKFLKEHLYEKSLFNLGNYMFIFFNFLAILFNVFGRVSLAHTLTLTAIIAITQVVAVSVMLRIILEIVMLQVYAIRLRRGITKMFDSAALEKKVRRPFLLIVAYLWLLVIGLNLNLSDTFYDIFERIGSRENKIGSFSFTIGGIVLFIFIIWIAHLLQQLAAYFFGGIDGEYGEEINKRQVSRLLITRLTVLVAGYLLAIAASGMPIDKITIILGALGVGVGLGLQSVVSNFVGGVILIFERPVQIGDMIDSGSQSGRIKEIGLRTTRLQTKDGAEVIIPNGNMLSQNIVNWTRIDNYKQVSMAFVLNGNISQLEIRKVITTALESITDIGKETPPELFFESVAGNKYKLKVLFWCNIYKTEQVVSEARMLLYENFAKKEISMED